MTIKRTLYRLRRKLLGNHQRSEWLPSRIYPEDLFIVSYPRSGNTWTRFLLANLIADEPIHLQNIAKYIPAIPGDRLLVEQLGRPRLIKSHAPYRPEYPNVIYLVRDVRDVYVSYYTFWKPNLPKGLTFSEFLRGAYPPAGWWHKHVEAWIDRPNVLLIKYEDMLANTHRELTRMVEFWGMHSFTEQQLADAIERSRFERMKRSEEKYRMLPRKDVEEKLLSESRLIRKGKAQNWHSHFSEADETLIIERAGHLMRRLGYLP